MLFLPLLLGGPSRQAEFNSVDEWARVNKLKVNLAKYAGIIFVDGRKKTNSHSGTMLAQVTSKFLAPTVCGLQRRQCRRQPSAPHIMLYAVGILRARTHCTTLRYCQSYRAAVVVKLLHASSAW